MTNRITRKRELGKSFSEKHQLGLEYSGKNGNILNFTYSEFRGSMARDAFTREFQVDLSDGNLGTYKGPVFEVLEATNAQIKYKIIRPFPEH